MISATDAFRPIAADPPIGAGRTSTSARESTYAWDIETDVIAWAADAAGCLGIESTATLSTGRQFAARLVPESETSREKAIWTGVLDGGTGVAYHARYGLIADPDDRDAAIVWLDDRGRWYAGAEGRPARAEGRIRRIALDAGIATIHPLAALIGREAFLEHVARKAAVLGRPPAAFALLVGGVCTGREDAFAAAVETLRAQMRTHDVLARVAADRLALFLDACNAEQMAIAADRFSAAVALTDGGFRFGGSVAPRDGRDAHMLLSRAEKALAAAVTSGATSFVAYQPMLD